MKIIVAVDFSGNSIHAAEQAIIWASANKAAIKFVYVSKVLTPTGSINFGVPVETSQGHIAQRTSDLKEYIRPILSKYQVVDADHISYHVENSAVSSDGIVKAAKDWAADFIIMGNKGESNLATTLFGSTTTSVLDKTDVPVITIPSDFLKNNWKSAGIGTDLVSVESDIERNAGLLSKIANTFDLVYINPVFPEKISLSEFSVDDLVARLKASTGLTFNWQNITMPVENDISGGMQKYVEEKNPDLLIMFYTRRNWFEKLIDSSHTKSMVLSNQVAVLSIKRNPKIA